MSASESDRVGPKPRETTADRAPATASPGAADSARPGGPLSSTPPGSASAPSLRAAGAGPQSFELRVRPTAEIISVIRDFVASYCREIVNDHDLANRTALTAHELLENAAKYSPDGAATLFVELDTASDQVVVRTTNRTLPERLATLRYWFGEIASATDAESLYARLITKTAVKASGSGGIGLARVWAESSMTLTLHVEEDVASIEARGRIGRGE